MLSQKTTTNRAYRLWWPRFLRVVLLGLLFCQTWTRIVHGVEVASDPYDVLYDVIMTRYQSDGTSYGQDETSPVILGGSRFPFDDQTFEKLNVALDAFAALPQAKIEKYSDIKRALLQSHVWKVYDATHPAYRNDWIENGRAVEQWGSHPRVEQPFDQRLHR